MSKPKAPQAPKSNTRGGAKPKKARPRSLPVNPPPGKPDPLRSRVVAIASDIHFDLESPKHWRSFRRWHAAVRPSVTILAGDVVDLGMLSAYPQEAGAPLRAIAQIKRMVKEVNPLVEESGTVYFLYGNHDERWEREVVGKHSVALDGAKGLSFHDQCLAHGLDKRVRWVKEKPDTHGITVGPFIIRHGHKQSGRFGGPMHIAANAITKGLGQSVVLGHHHRAQVYCRSAFGKTAVAIANPCLTREHHYAPDADWQRGFTILELHGPDGGVATPYVVIMQEDGSFSWGGNVYRGDP